MTAPVLAGGMRRREAKKSTDYVEHYRRASGGAADVSTYASLMSNVPTLSTMEKTARMENLLADPDGFRRLGVGMVGPVQLKLRYEGIVRNVLMEDAVPAGSGGIAEYEVWDDLGQAYILSGVDGEVRVTPFEGKRVQVQFFRIASFPAIRKEDLIFMRMNAVEQAQDETKQSIMKQEDSRLMILLQAAVTSYASKDALHTGGHNVNVVGNVTPTALYAAATLVDVHELHSTRLLCNPVDYRDFYLFDQNTTGWAMKDRVVAGDTITQFGEFQIQRSIIVPQGVMFLLPDPNFLGVLPILYSLDVEENPQAEQFWRGWVMDEMISMAILNPRGIVTITKS